MENPAALPDDIIVINLEFQTHEERLQKVFGRLAKAGLKHRPSKCKLLQKQ